MAVEHRDGPGPWPAQDSLDELALLALTAGAQVVGRLIQRLPRPHPAYYLGKGKLEELAQLRQSAGYDLVVFDDELSPLQQRNIENALQIKVLDRTALILDIFARRAQTREGQLQVELAQHQYLLPRLAGRWAHLERLGGGIGTRGPGETQLETDRRLVSQKITRLKKEIEKVREHRALYRRQRGASGLSVIALVGYTNSGKSTLLNALTHAGVAVEDKLFATLDPVTRRLALPDGRQVLVTDTVGFIQKLPPAVVAAFRATLEELGEADLLVHVIDITHARAAEQCRAVEEILGGLGLGDKPRVMAFNKVDLLADGEGMVPRCPEGEGTAQGANLISAARGWGLDQLLSTLARALPAPSSPLLH